MWICRYFVLFSLFSFLGWVYETCYCTVKTGKWDNRGFLFGPVCPIYGSGAVGIGIVYDLIQNSSFADSITWWEIFIIAYIGSVILEYVTHWALEKKFHAYWWDYSNVPLNIHGRVCVPASFAFGCAGVLIYYVIYPDIANLVNPIPAIVMELLALICMGILAADTALTVAALTNVLNIVENMEDTINRQMELVVENIEMRKNGVENAIEYSRERITNASLERALHQMSGYGRSSLTRIKGFRTSANAISKMELKGSAYMHGIWQMAKVYNPIRKVKEIRNEKEGRK